MWTIIADSIFCSEGISFEWVDRGQQEKEVGVNQMQIWHPNSSFQIPWSISTVISCQYHIYIHVEKLPHGTA